MVFLKNMLQSLSLLTSSLVVDGMPTKLFTAGQRCVFYLCAIQEQLHFPQQGGMSRVLRMSILHTALAQPHNVLILFCYQCSFLKTQEQPASQIVGRITPLNEIQNVKTFDFKRTLFVFLAEHNGKR